jgi:hypothetical protein
VPLQVVGRVRCSVPCRKREEKSSITLRVTGQEGGDKGEEKRRMSSITPRVTRGEKGEERKSSITPRVTRGEKAEERKSSTTLEGEGGIK